MDKKLTDKLLKINYTLYEEEADSFSKSRNNVWEKEIIDFINQIHPKSKILDLGCGNARLYQILAQKEINYLGIDPSKKLIALNKNKYPNAKFEVGDGLALSYENKFDYIFSIAVIHHIPGKDLQLKFLKNIYNALKSGGKVIITSWNRWQPKYWKSFVNKPVRDLSFKETVVPWKNGNNSRFVYAFTKTELNNLAIKTGFKNIKTFYSKHGKKTNIINGLNIYLTGEK